MASPFRKSPSAWTARRRLLDHYRDQPDLVRRFIEEARITGQLQHPFIVPVHKLGTLEDGRPYFAMKLVEGRTFSDLLRERSNTSQDLSRHLKVFEQICQTIAYAHSKGVIHRDLKPANVMVGLFGEVQVMDWGLAKVLNDHEAREERAQADTAAGKREEKSDQTQAGAVLGTYAYMPPEQARGELPLVSRRSDVFGLGAILCEILTGLPPYSGDIAQVRSKARTGDATDAIARLDACGADAPLIGLAKSCLAIDPDSRPEDGSRVADEMTRYFAAVEERVRLAEIARTRAETETVEERKRVVLAEQKAEAERRRGTADRRRRRATAMLAASVVMLLLVAACFGLWYQRDQWDRETEIAARRNVTERDVTAALAEVRLRREEGIKQADYPERWKEYLQSAWDAWRRANNALKLGAPTEELAAQVDQARTDLEQDGRDRDFLLTLERRWLEANSLSREDVRAPRDVSFLTRVFKDHGLDLDALTPSEAAAWVRKHPHRTRLADEIENIGHLQATLTRKPALRAMQVGFRGVQIGKADWSKAEKTRQILDEIDADPQAFGTRWRAARLKNDAEAMIQLAKALDADAVSPRGAVALANDLIAFSAFDEAHQMLRKVHDRHPSNYFLVQMLGILAIARHQPEGKGSLDEAIGYFHAAQAIRGNNPATNLFLSQIHRARGRMDEAIRCARAGVKADPESAPAHHNLGTLHFGRKEWDEALRCYHLAAEYDAVSAIPLDALGQTYFEKGDYDKALYYYDLALQREPEFAGVYVNKGNALGKKNDLDGAIRHYEKALDLFPNYGLAHNNLGLSVARKGDVPRAIKCLTTALECDPDLVQAYYDLGDMLLLFQRDAEAALKAYEGPVKRFPNSAHAHYQLADILMKMGRPFPASESFRRAITLEANHPGAHAGLGMALAALNQWDGAIDAYRTALDRLDKNIQSAAKANLLNLLGNAHAKKGEWDKAVSRYQEALKIDPLRGQVHANLGAAYKFLWKVDEAIDAYQTALEQDADNALLHYEMAFVRLERNDIEGAIRHARRSLDLSPKRPEPYGVLAQAFIEQGEVAEAVEAARKGKELLGPLDPDLGNVQVVYQVSQQFNKGEEMFPALLKGEAKPADVVQRNALAMVAGLKHRKYAAAAKLCAESFAADPLRANNVTMGGRYRGACFAVLAGTGHAEKEAALSDDDKAKLRKQALDWLRADLDGWRQVHRFAPSPDRHFPVFRLRLWLNDPCFKDVRDQALEKLPAAEREDWTRLWSDVKAFTTEGATPRTGTDIAGLRKLAHFPAIGMNFDVQFNSSTEKRDARGNIIDPAKKIEELLTRLNGTAADAEHLIEIIFYHCDLKQEDKAKETARKAEALLKPYLNTRLRQDARRLVEAAVVHGYLYPEKWTEREGWLTRAVELDPNDWKAWSALAGHRHAQVHTTILGGRFPDKNRPNEAKEWLHTGKVPAARVDEAEKWLAQARKHHDKAKELGLHVEKQWDARIGFLLAEVEWIHGFRVARGAPPLPVDHATPEWQARGYKGGIYLGTAPGMLGELCEAAERCPEHIGMQFFGMMHMLPRLKDRVMRRDPLKDTSSLASLKETQFLDDTLARIREIGKKCKGEAAVYCDRLQVLLLMQMTMMEQSTDRGLAKIEPILRRIVAADPKDHNASMFLEMCLVEQGNKNAGLELAKRRAAEDPSVINRYTLARALDYTGQTEAAAKELDAALRAFPEDVHCLGGRAALWLRDGDEAIVPKAGEFLDRARAGIKPQDPPTLAEDIEFLQAIQRIAAGHTVIGRITLDQLKAAHPHDRKYTNALQMLEP